jgi:hypothetical protein
MVILGISLFTRLKAGASIVKAGGIYPAPTPPELVMQMKSAG